MNWLYDLIRKHPEVKRLEQANDDWRKKYQEQSEQSSRLVLIIGQKVAFEEKREAFQKYGLTFDHNARHTGEVDTLRRINEPCKTNRYHVLFGKDHQTYFGKCKNILNGSELNPEQIYRDIAEVSIDIPSARPFIIGLPINILPQNLL
jgi:hypothetical protein